jgi:hypothetical protein
MENLNASEEDWELLKTFLPERWREMAVETGALKGLRQDKSEEGYLRVLLLHLGCGFSLRETVARARQAGLVDLSDVALLKRVRKSKDWLHALCRGLLEERQVEANLGEIPPLRLIDSTLVKEPGPTGSQWRIHYSLKWPGLSCDHFKITPVEGKGTGEALWQYPLQSNEYVVADRGYCRANDFHHAASQGAKTLIRLNPHGIRLTTKAGKVFPLLKRLSELKKTGQVCEWPVWLPLPNAPSLPLRLCVIRKNKTSIAQTLKKLRRDASRDQRTLEPETLRYAEFVMVLTTFPSDPFPARRVLEYYRFRWQIELLFKRFKQLAELGHLPKHDEDSSQAWLYGKLFVALLTEKLIAHARDFSPWGYPIGATSQSLARVRLC